MQYFRLSVLSLLGLVAAGLYWPMTADAQTFVCPNGPGPGENQVGMTGGSGGIAAIPICASDGSEDSSDADSPPAGPEWESRWGAIARGKAGGWGAVTDMLSEKIAAKSALRQCKASANTKNAECKVWLTYFDQCAVYVWGTAGGISSSAVDEQTASERALALCRETSNDCEILYSACSLPKRIN